MKKEIIELIESLDAQKQEQVLAYLKGLLEESKPSNSKRLVNLAGILDDQSAKEMMEAIEDGCGKVA